MKINLRRDMEPSQRPSMVNRPSYGSDNIRPSITPQTDKVISEKKPTRVPKIIDWVAVGAVYLLAFLVPLFFLPNVPSILELNKQLLIVVLGGIAFLAWIGKLAWEGKIRIKKNFLIIPVLLVLVVFALNTVFSVYRDQSMWGALGSESMSLVTIITLIALFFVITNNFNNQQKVRRLILIIIGSSVLANIYLILQIFGKFIFKNPAVAQTSFNTIGSVYAFSIFLGAILIATVAMLLEKQSSAIKISLLISTLLFLFTLIMINFQTSLVIFLVGMAVLLGLSIITSSSEEKNRTLIIPMVVLTLVLLATLIGKRGSLVRVQLPVEIGLSNSASFDVLKGTWKDKFLLGPGHLSL